MTPKEILSEELARLDVLFPLMTSIIDFWYRWYSDQMVVIRLFKDARLIDQFSYKIVTMGDISDFRKVFAKKIAKYTKEEIEND